MNKPGDAIYFHGRIVGVWAKCPACNELSSKPPMGTDPFCSTRCKEAK